MNMYLRILLCFILLFASHANAERYSHNIPHKLKNFVSSLDQREKQLQGGAIAILHKGQIIYKSSFGYGRGDSEPITSHTLFPLASVSKIVTTAAIALMLDKKELDLDKQYSFPFLKSKVSLKNILGNSTGYRYSGNQDIEVGATREKLFNKLKSLPQSCAPGKCYFYSNLCFSLASEILHKEKLDLRVAINKLKNALKITELEVTTVPENAVVAYPHIKNKKGHGFIELPFPPYYPKAVPAAAGIFASIDSMIELFKFQFFYRPDLISNDTLNIFYKPYLAADVSHWKLTYPVDSHYGLGWRIFKSPKVKNKDLIFHSGMIAGINSFVGFIPSEEIGIIILLNQAAPAATKLGLDFWREFL